MGECAIVSENTCLFVKLDDAVAQVAQFMTHFENIEVLMVALCQNAMPVANEIALTLRLNLIFSAVDLNTKTAEFQDKRIPVAFDYGIVKESGRDIPQNFIVHQEQNLRTDLISVYTQTYEKLRRTYPDKLIILVDQLTNIDAAFFQCVNRNITDQVEGNSFSIPTIRHFIFLHAFDQKLGNVAKQGFDIIIKDNGIDVM